MKILHIGKQGNLQRFAAADGFLNSLDLVDLKPDLPVEEYLNQAGDHRRIDSANAQSVGDPF